MEAENHTHNTLFGRVTLAVKFEDGREAHLTVHQLRLNQYPAALKVIEDEFGLAALCCGVPAPEIMALHPESYETVRRAVEVLNQDGFFTFAARQEARAAANLRHLPPGLVEKLISRMPSPISPPKAA